MRRFPVPAMLLVLTLVVAGCGPAATPQVIRETVVVTREVETVETVEVERVVRETVEVVVPATPEPPETLKVGLSIGLSGGGGGDFFLKYAQGAELATDWINERGGITIRGEKYLIELLVEDDKTTPEGAVAAVNKLVFEDGVEFIIGPVAYPLTQAVAPTMEEAGVLSLIQHGEELDHAETPYTIYSGPMAQTGCGVAYDYLVDAYPNAKNLAIVMPDTPSHSLFGELCKPLAEARGLTVVAREYYPIPTQDYYPIMTKVIAAEPDAVNVVGPDAWNGSMLKSLRELGFQGPVFSANGAGDPYTVADIAGTELATDYFGIDVDLTSPRMTPMIKEIMEQVSDKLGQEADANHLFGWEALDYMVRAIEAAQSLDPAEVRSHLAEMTSFETIYGMGFVGGLETYGASDVIVAPIPIFRIMNSEVEHVRWSIPELP